MPTSREPQGWLASAAHAVRSLTLSNVLVIFLLLCMVAPAYVVWKVVNDEALLDRFLSSYSELPSDSDCVIREARQRGEPERWSIATGFAFAGTDQWTVAVILDHAPTEGEIESYCASLLLIVDKMHNDHQ